MTLVACAHFVVSSTTWITQIYGLIAGHKVAGWQPIRIQHLRSLPLIAQSAVENTATLWSVINPEKFSNS